MKLIFNRFEITIALRYLRKKTNNSFISFIAIVSVIGIALGVMTLITVLSVMNGFQHEIRQKIIGITSHMQITNAANNLINWQNIQNIIQNNKHVLAAAPYIDGQALLSFDGNVNGVMIRGIDLNSEANVNDITNHIVDGNFNSLQTGSFNIAIGSDLSRLLGVTLGDKIIVITPSGQITPAGMIPRLKQFTITAIFNTHMYEYDSSLVFINLTTAQKLFKKHNAITGIRIKVDDIMNTNNIKIELGNVLPDDLLVADWIDQHQNYFSAVNTEKNMMFIILTLIIAVATFNLVSTLMMVVNDKKTDIAILRTMGATKANIIKIFLLNGTITGVIGTVIGTICGLLLANYINNIVQFVEFITHSQLINKDVYLIDYLPSQINIFEVGTIFAISIILSIIATIYPSIKAASTDPVQILRNE